MNFLLISCFHINILHDYFYYFLDFHIEEAVDWPGINIKLGQVSGLALDPEYNLVLFHRGDHVWDEK